MDNYSPSNRGYKQLSTENRENVDNSITGGEYPDKFGKNGAKVKRLFVFIHRVHTVIGLQCEQNNYLFSVKSFA